MDKKKIILAIDDHVTQLKAFELILTPDYDVRIVKSASDAMNYLTAKEADIILLDIEMPNISGFEFLGDIRKIPSKSTVPIIIVSSNSGEDFFKRARNSSAFDVLTKPVTKEMLIETIEKALEN
jgi:PleD family two-component response regulator